MDLGLITESTLVDDSADIVLNGKPNWYPRNSGGVYSGIITIWDALVNSKNTVAAQILDKLTTSVSFEYLTERMGFNLPEVDRDYAPLALGQFTNGVTVREMAQAYSAFVNDGTFTYSRTYSLVTDSNGGTILDNQPRTITAFSANTAHCISYMLENAVSRGTGTSAKFGSTAVAGKTGTTTDYQDRWFVGYTEYYVAAVWTGYDQPEYVRASGNPAATVFRQIMSKVHSGLAYKSFTYPYLGDDTGLFGINNRNDEEEEYSNNIYNEEDTESSGSTMQDLTFG